MQPEQEKRLREYTGQCIGIGITEEGKGNCAISVPWELTAHAFRMRTPDVYLEPADLQDEDLMEYLKQFKVLGLYILTPLPEYDFIRRFPQLRDIYILYGNNLVDLSFLDDTPNWDMLFVHRATLKDLEPIRHKRSKTNIQSQCIGFSLCVIDDISGLVETEHYVTELVILQPRGVDDRARWQQVKAGNFYYYNLNVDL